MNGDILAAMIVGTWELLVILIIYPLTCVLPAVVFWKICTKAGFPGALGLLMFVPIANFVLPLYVAFAQWPVLKGKEKNAFHQ